MQQFALNSKDQGRISKLALFMRDNSVNMDTSEPLLDFLCRTCMQELVVEITATNTKQNKQWQSICDTIEEFGSKVIAELLSSAVPQLEVQLNDELPKKICLKCVAQLQSIYRFQNLCLQSQEQLVQLNARTGAKQIPEAGVEREIITINCLVHETNAEETKDEDIEFAAMESTPTVTPSGDVDDPLEIANKVEVENCENLELVASVEMTPADMKTEQVSLPAPENSCSQCNKSFKYPCLLQYHLKSHQKEKFEYKRYECDLCERFFFKPETLQQHLLEHNSAEGIRTYPCDVCNKTLSSEYSLRKHKRYQHTGEKMFKVKKFPCELCNKAFVAPTALRTHLRTHTGERPYLCPECGKSFITPGCLKQHRFRHDIVKRYECPHCPLKFSASSDLGKHKLTHPENKRHICDICGELISTYNVLKKHKRYHSGIKPYKCEHCDKCFVVDDACRRHMRIHTGEKPYKCKYCHRAFAQSGDHMKHLRLHIGDNIYRCELCPSAFRLLSEKRLHFATHKNDDEQTRERNMQALKEAEAQLELKASLSKKTKIASET